MFLPCLPIPPPPPVSCLPVLCWPRKLSMSFLPVPRHPKRRSWMFCVILSWQSVHPDLYCPVFQPCLTTFPLPFLLPLIIDSPRLECSPAQPMMIDPVAPPRTFASDTPPRPFEQLAPPSLSSNFNCCSLGSTLVSHRSACTMDFWSFTRSSSLHPYDSVGPYLPSGSSLGPQSLCLCLSLPYLGRLLLWLRPVL